MIIESPSDLVCCVEQVREKYGAGCWWRGQASTAPAWKLAPRVFRDDRARYEEWYCGEFVRRAPHLDRTAPPIHEKHLWQVYAQHCGVPTRLLDWSSSALVAAWFAVSPARHAAEDGRIWVIDPLVLNHKCMGEKEVFSYINSVPGPIAHLFVEPASDSPVEGHVAAVVARTASPRMLAQSAGLTVHSTTRCVASELEQLGVCERFDIPAAAKPRLLGVLGDMGITRSALFPDVFNLAGEIADAVFTPA